MKKATSFKLLKQALASFLEKCDAETVKVYGPYPPSPGRARWRIQLRCSETNRKVSVMFPTKAEAELAIPCIRAEIEAKQPIRLHAAIEQYLGHKHMAGLVEGSIRSIKDRLFSMLPEDCDLRRIDAKQAEDLYLTYAGSSGKFGTIKAATHHAVLRNVKEMFRWFVRKELCPSNPFESVEAVGKVNTGKQQLRETDAMTFDRYLFKQAERGEEGALALLVQLYVGMRSGEVLSLTVAMVEREGKKISVIRGKSKNAKRSLEVFAPVAALLWERCKGRPGNERVFARNLAKVPGPSWMYKRLKRYLRDAGLPQVCPHSLRGLHSTLAVASGATTHAVASQLGHASFATTARHYTDPSALDNARIRKLADTLHPDRDGEKLRKLPKEDRQRLLQLLQQEDAADDD